jgi:hypothetical protein
MTAAPAIPHVTIAATRSAAPAPSRQIPLEPFQRLMLAWEEAHPYNAAHLVKLAGPANVPALHAAITRVLAQSGIGRLHVNKKANRLHFDAGRQPLICVARADHDIDQEALGELAESMNLRFSDAPHDPFRWLLIDESNGRWHVLVLVYHHVVSDGRGIQSLLTEILERYIGAKPLDSRPALSFRDPAAADPKRRRIGLIGFVRAYLRAVRLHLRILASYRMPEATDRGYETGVTALRAPPTWVQEITRTCAARGVGFNDACLAALACALARITREQRARRLLGRRIALGTIMSTQHDDGSVPAGLGVHLGGLIIIVRNPDAHIDDVLTQVSRETHRLKTNRDAAQRVSVILAFFARRVLPFLGVPNSRETYRFIFPICAGVSTLFVGNASENETMRGVRRYIRVSPPGPAMPIVLSPTILEDGLELSLTYRLSCLKPREAAAVLESVMHALCDLSSGRPAYGHL